MTTLPCPKCRYAMPDEALDLGACPACGFPITGPVVLGAGARSGGGKLVLALAGVAALAAGGFAGFTFLNQSHLSLSPAPDHADRPPDVPEIDVAPMPHEPGSDSASTGPTESVAAEGQDPNRPRPIGVVMKVNPKLAPVRHLDHPDDTAALPDLNSNDRVVLTGRVRVLRIGSVNGKGRLDASRLVAEAILITGDLNSQAEVKLNAPGGSVTIGGFVAGSSKLTVTAPDGLVLVAHSARLTGDSRLTITAKRLEAMGPLSGHTEVRLTLSAGGALLLKLTEEDATLTYRKMNRDDPPLSVDAGVIRGGAKVMAGN